jgi:Prion-inhibition and propagation/Protein tyrosine and serine/threonine kinase
MPTGLEEGASAVAFFSIGFQCLSGCIKGFDVISTGLRLGRQATYFRCAILVEEQRLLRWAMRSGLSNGTLDQRLNEKLINDVLATLNNLLCSTAQLSERYGLSIKFNETPTENSAAPTYDALSGDDLEFLTREDVRRERENILEKANRIQSWAGIRKKFWFAAVDKEKFAELLDEVGSLIQALHGLLNDQIQDELREAAHLQRLQSIGLASNISELKSMIEAFEMRHMTNLPETTSALLRIIKILEGRTVLAGSQPNELEEILSKAPSRSHISLQYVFEDRLTDKKLLGDNSLRGTIKYDGVLHYVEWKKYDWPNSGKDEPKSKEAGKMILDSINNLALLLNAPKHPSFRTLSCSGVVREERSHRYLFLYKWPSEREGDTTPRSLQEYMSTSYKPSLTERLQLGRDLAISLFFLHAANWMHKAFSSRNILFFPKSASAARSLEEPFIVGFEYSRPDQENEPSEKLDKNPEADIYRHPDLLTNDPVSFHKSFDIYSFGLVLLEIAKWRPLKEIYIRSSRDRYLSETKRSKESMTKEQIHDLDRELLESCRHEDVKHMHQVLIDTAIKDSHPGDIAFRAGLTVSSVVMACLRMDFDQFRVHGGNGQDLQEAFFRKVLKPLQGCTI